MKKTKQSIIAILLMASATFFTSCYTVLVHSHRQTRSEQTNEAAVAEDETCTLCGGEHPTLMHYSGMLQDPAFGVHSRWYEYYESPAPWWIPANTSGEETGDNANDETNYSGRNYGRRRAALEEKSSGTSGGGSVQSGSGGYSGAPTGGGYAGGGAVATNPPAQTDTTNRKTDLDSGSVSTDQSKNSNNKQREYGGRTVRKNK